MGNHDVCDGCWNSIPYISVSYPIWVREICWAAGAFLFTTHILEAQRIARRGNDGCSLCNSGNMLWARSTVHIIDFTWPSKSAPHFFLEHYYQLRIEKSASAELFLLIEYIYIYINTTQLPNTIQLRFFWELVFLESWDVSCCCIHESLQFRCQDCQAHDRSAWMLMA